MKQATRPAAILTGIFLVVTWIVVIAITVPQAQSIGPQPNGDYGFFTAVAERLVAGDRLYVDIWDNKDPFVFYSIALVSSLGVWGAWALELTWVVSAAIATWVITGWARVVAPLRTFVAWVAAPLILVGLPYFMGSTHLPGIALSLAAYAAALRLRIFLAGLLVAVLFFFKLMMIPLAISLILVAIYFGKGVERDRGRRRCLGVFAVATGLGVFAGSALMALRGEFIPYVNAQVANVLYSQAPIVPQSDPSFARTVIQHVVVLANPHVVAIGLTSLLMLFWFWWAILRPSRDHDVHEVLLWWSAAIGLFVSGLTIIAVAKWLHHALILAVPSILIVVLVARMLQRTTLGKGVIGVLSLALVTVILSGIPNPSIYATAVRNLPISVEAAERTDLLTEILMSEQPGSFAAIGYGNLVPRSFQVTNRTLACRHIAQRHFDPPRNFEETLECLPQANIIVFAPDALERDGFPEFNAFLANAREFVATQRLCREEQGFTICTTSTS